MEKDDSYCDTELCLSPGTSRRHQHPSSESSNTARAKRSGLWTPENMNQRQQKQITFFYAGQISTCDVTEIQAKAIICMAKREMEERMAQNGHSSAAPPPPSVTPVTPPIVNTGLSMKKSLYQFLEKRKARMSSTAGPCEN